VVFWFIVLLNKLTNPNFKLPKSLSTETVKCSVNQILDIIKFFTQSEARVRINIANAELFKLLIRTYKNLEFNHQSIVLKYFRSISMISETLNLLHQADILEFLIELLENYNPSSSHYKEVMSIVCPMLYNCCYLNHHREHELVELGAVPYLKSLAMTNLPFRQFVLPILCELVYCDDNVRQVLKQHDILTLYFNLLLDPYWQSNAMDSIIVWIQQDESSVDLKSTRAINCILTGLLLSTVSNMESTLDNYLKLFNMNRDIVRLMFKETILQNIFQKLAVYNRNPVIQLSLLRLLKILLIEGKATSLFTDVSYQVIERLQELDAKNSVLIEELIQEIRSIVQA